MSAILKCKCGVRNRLKPTSAPQRCGACGSQFTTAEILRATLGDRPDVPEPELMEREGFDEEDEEDDEEDY